MMAAAINNMKIYACPAFIHHLGVSQNNQFVTIIIIDLANTVLPNKVTAPLRSLIVSGVALVGLRVLHGRASARAGSGPGNCSPGPSPGW